MVVLFLVHVYFNTDDCFEINIAIVDQSASGKFQQRMLSKSKWALNYHRGVDRGVIEVA